MNWHHKAYGVAAIPPSLPEKAQIASAATYATAGGTVVLGLTWGEIAAIIGAVATIITTAANLWFRWRMYQLAKREVE